MGLAFVAWTRSTSWEKTAFQALPPIQDFLAVRLSREFIARCAFEARADQLHDALLISRGIDEQEHIRDHEKHLQDKVRSEWQRDITSAERADLEQMLCRRGVAPVSDSALRLGAVKSGSSNAGGLWSIVASFRADKSNAKKEESKKQQRRGSGKTSSAGGGSDIVRVIL